MKRNTKILIGAIGLALGVTGVAYAAQGYRAHKEMHRAFGPEAMLKRMDTNGDLAVSLDEILTTARQRFEAGDGNKDLKLTKPEIVAAIDSLDGFDRLKRHSGRIADRVVRRTDIDQNGEVLFTEIENRARKFHALADWNDDGVVELEELKRTAAGWRHGKRWRHRQAQ